MKQPISVSAQNFLIASLMCFILSACGGQNPSGGSSKSSAAASLSSISSSKSSSSSFASQPVDTKPTALIGLSNAPYVAGTAVALSGDQSSDDKGISLYEWRMVLPSGEDWRATGKTANFTPSLPGLYKLTLTVTDTAGQTKSLTRDINVEAKKSTSIFPTSVIKPRIMLLGDSLTGGSGCWKKLFAAKLKADGKTNYEFVGTRKDDCGGGIMHEGHSCAKASDFIKDTYNNQCSGQENGLARLLKTNKPDMVMMTLGTNDAWGVPGVNVILQSYTKLIQIMREYNPNMVIAVAQIPKMKPDNNQNVYKQVEDLFKAVPAWAQPLNQPNSPVIVADLWTNFNVTDTSDGVHPTDAVGHPKVADNWYKAVGDILW